jgi:diaminopimelate epimerase
VYLVTEAAGLTDRQVRELVGDADGILEVTAHGSAAADVVVWNPDGSHAELSGNGTRIAAAWLTERSGARGVEVAITVGPRTVTVSTLPDGSVEQEIGEVRVGERETVDGIAFVPVDVGNPHAVVEGEPEQIAAVGPALESHPRFPNRTNVQVARVERRGEVWARVWERGVGETESSGTSAVAVAAATHTDGDVLVHFPGGDLRVRLSGGRAWLTGPPATRVEEESPNPHGPDTPA